ncbi:2Fe-2S iron-sulfur cluster-binding protein [Bermanella sp. WJH001]|uniref:2Fe-2S iron-sulfur cluster-binding protein n=1 Tax=Bermanella sp. WJH001 TaxID=3048005 RepID=UPI0024BEB225|nr:2Fe-2S iron-sulfur cluster-binding protein [Bermanella sp. WJH001]MDJ1537746.1 FAD-binding oxidoreductase [Bermanella sp. WJH001]
MANTNELLENIVGYSESAARKLAREQTGGDFSEQKWKTKHDIAKLHPKRLHLTVTDIFQDTPSTKTFRLVSHDAILPPFQAGQYINLFTTINGVETARPYAISSCPTQRGYYDLTVKLVQDGFVTNYLLGDDVTVGQAFSATSPMGTFYHNPLFHGDDLVFLAGGSGGAPARSMIESVLNRGLNIKFHLIYGNSYENDVIFQDTFRDLANKYENFTLTEVISRPTENYTGLTGHLNQNLLVDVLGNVTNKTFYICGPTPFNDFCVEQLKALGVEDKRMRIECNGPPKKPSCLAGWPQVVTEQDDITVTVKGRGQFVAKAGEPLLNSLERNGYTVENACRSGECSLCRVKIIEGEVFNPPESLLRKSDKDFGWVHSCVAFPVTDIEILY